MKIDYKALWNHGGSMFATFWIVIALYALGGYLVWAFLQLDAEFSRPLAGEVIPANVTQQIAWGIRAFSVIAGSLAIYFAAHKMRGWARWFTFMTVFAAILLLVHAFGVSAKIMQKQYSAVSSISEVATVDKDSIQAEIDDLIDERDGLPALTDSAVATFQRSIDSITNDGLDNDDEAQEFADKQVAAIEARDARLAEIRTELSDKRKELRGTAGQEIQDNATESSFNDLFIFGARLSTNTWDPSKDPADTHKFIWGVAFFTFWFGFGEILMMACFTGGYAVLKLRSVQQMEKDPARVAAGKKGAETKSRRKRRTLKIQEQADSYLPAWRKAVQYANIKTYTAKGIAQTAFPRVSIDHVIELLRKANEVSKGEWRPELEEEIALVKRLKEPDEIPESKRYAVDIIDPDPETTNGTGQPPEQESEDAANDGATGAVSSN